LNSYPKLYFKIKGSSNDNHYDELQLSILAVCKVLYFFNEWAIFINKQWILCYVEIDRSWVNASWVSGVYDNDVEEFLQSAQRKRRLLNGKYYW